MIINENQHDIVYGNTFSRLKKNQIKDLVKNYKIRLEVNKLNPKKIFGGKKCLDAGCGFGRGSIFLLSNKAKHVTAIDISDNNVKTTKTNLKKFGYKNFIIKKKNISNLPYKSNTFDIVWCYGVIHHAKNTDKCLSEISRVLKKNGHLKLFVYGSGGIFWYVMDKFRKYLFKYKTNEIIKLLVVLGYSENDVINFIDNWKTPYLRKYTSKDLNKRLESLGFKNPKPHKMGLNYDPHHRIKMFRKDKDWMGEGDLRYLLKKTTDSHKNLDTYNLSNSEQGSKYNYNNKIIKKFEKRFLKLEKKLKNNMFLSVSVCAMINKKLLNLLKENKPFDENNFDKYIKNLSNLL